MMNNFSIVDKDELYRGAAPSAEDLKMLRDIWGVKRIISLDGDVGAAIRPICKELGLDQMIIPLGGGFGPNVAKLKGMIPVLTDYGPTYIHCLHGKDRTSMAVAMYRIWNGWSLEDAINEAANFKMGLGLSPDMTRSYYNSVKLYWQETHPGDRDVAAADDAVEAAREARQNVNQTPAINDATIPNFGWRGAPQPMADPEMSPLNRTASGKIYTDAKNPKKPGTKWFSSKENAKFEAEISSDADIDDTYKDVKETKELRHKALVRDSDVIIFDDNVYIIRHPGILNNIREVGDDKNDAFLPGEVGTRDRLSPNSSTTNLVFPGSHGFMGEGFAGGVVLPNQAF